LEVDWTEVEKRYEAFGLTPSVPSTASRTAVPVYSGRAQAGKATSSTWSPTLKKMIALSSLSSEHAAKGTRLDMEMTIEAVRQRVGVTVVDLPFFSPPRKTATPV
jgi:aminomethyltransferase